MVGPCQNSGSSPSKPRNYNDNWPTVKISHHESCARRTPGVANSTLTDAIIVVSYYIYLVVIYNDTMRSWFIYVGCNHTFGSGAWLGHATLLGHAQLQACTLLARCIFGPLPGWGGMHSYRHATLLGLLLSSLPLHFLVALCGPPDAFAHNSKHKCAVAPLWPSSSILPRITKVWLHPTYDVYNMINIYIYIYISKVLCKIDLDVPGAGEFLFLHILP